MFLPALTNFTTVEAGQDMADWLACPYKEMCLAAAAACRCRHLSQSAGQSDFVLKTAGGLSFQHSLISLFSQ